MMVSDSLPESTIVRPTTDGSAPNLVRHARSLTMATLRSSGSMSRPSCTRAPTMGSSVEPTRSTWTTP